MDTTSSSISYITRKELDAQKYSWAFQILVPVVAIVVQAFVPLRIRFFSIFDLPLLVTIFLAVSRRSPVGGAFTGALIGTVQDAIAGTPIGVNGLANTVVGYLASSIGLKIDVENIGSRFIMIFCFTLVHHVIHTLVNTRIVGKTEVLYLTRFQLGSVVAISILGVAIFSVLDRFKIRN